MRSRLVVGQSRLAGDVLDALERRDGPLYVVSDDRDYLEALGERDLSATVHNADPTDPAALAALDGVESVLALDDDGVFNAAVLRAAGEAFPAAFELGYVGTDGVAAVQERADRVVDPGRATLEALTDRLGGAAAGTRRLKRTLTELAEPLAVVMHDNPDPDAIASAMALCRIAETVGVESEACYYGSITHQENRAFVNLLDIDLRALDAEAGIEEFGSVALVDHSRPGDNDQLPPDTAVDIVIDHHPPRGPVDGTFVDLRSDVGATSTLMVEYFQQLGIEFDERTATALLFGIRIDTDEFSREVSVSDFEAAAALIGAADLGTLQRVESPSIDPDTLETIADAIVNRERHGPALVSGVGRLHNRDALAQAADRLLNLEDVTTTLVHGIMDGTVYVSARSRGADIDLGEVLQDAFGQIGSAGGHADMAGAQIELGVIGDTDDVEDLAAIVDQVLTDRFLEALEGRWNRPVQSLSGGEFSTTGESVDTGLFETDSPDNK